MVFLLRTRSFALFFVARDGIIGFGIAPAKHCNLVFCSSFVLRIDWLKPFLTVHTITSGVNGLNGFIYLRCNTTISKTIGRKVLFHHRLRLPFVTKQRCSWLRLPRDQGFPTGGTRTPKGYEIDHQGVRRSLGHRAAYISLIEQYMSQNFFGGTKNALTWQRGTSSKKRLGTPARDCIRSSGLLIPVFSLLIF